MSEGPARVRGAARRCPAGVCGNVLGLGFFSSRVRGSGRADPAGLARRWGLAVLSRFRTGGVGLCGRSDRVWKAARARGCRSGSCGHVLGLERGLCGASPPLLLATHLVCLHGAWGSLGHPSSCRSNFSPRKGLPLG